MASLRQPRAAGVRAACHSSCPRHNYIPRVAATAQHNSSFARTGGPVPHFPTSVYPEFPMSQIAIDYYKNGPSLLQEYLPFWMTIYARRAIALLAAMLAILLPVFGFAPKLYGWFVQEHLRRLYRRLRSVKQRDGVPMRNSDLYFTLKYHLDRMHSRLVDASRAARAGEGRT